MLKSLILEDDAHSQLHIDQLPSHTVSIEHLTLTGIDIRAFDFRNFSNVSSLALKWVWTTSSLLYGLMNLPSLTELFWIGTDTQVPLDWHIRVSLPCLTYLHISGWMTTDGPRDTPTLMSCLEVPAVCVINIDCEMAFRYEYLHSLLSIPQFTGPANQYAALTVTGECVGFSNAPAGFKDISNVDLRYSSVKIAEEEQYDYKFTPEWAECVNECISLLFAPGSLFSSITTLYLDAPDFLTFGIFKHITDLFLEDFSLTELLPIISADEHGLLFPSLKRLGLIVGAAAWQLDSVIAYLTWRRDRNAGIDALELRYQYENSSSHVMAAHCDSLQSLNVAIDLFHVVDRQHLVRSTFEPAPADSGGNYTYRLQPPPITSCCTTISSAFTRLL